MFVFTCCIDLLGPPCEQKYRRNAVREFLQFNHTRARVEAVKTFDANVRHIQHKMNGKLTNQLVTFSINGKAKTPLHGCRHRVSLDRCHTFHKAQSPSNFNDGDGYR